MAGRGPTPKDPAKRQRRNAEPETVELGRDAGDDVEVRPMMDGEWHAETVAWWETWCRSAQAAQFIETDWMTLRMMTPLVDQYVRNPAKATLGEIRLQHAKLGATPEDRLRLRWKLRAADQEAEREEKVAAAGGGGSAKVASRQKVDPRLSVLQGGRT